MKAALTPAGSFGSNEFYPKKRGKDKKKERKPSWILHFNTFHETSLVARFLRIHAIYVNSVLLVSDPQYQPPTPTPPPALANQHGHGLGHAVFLFCPCCMMLFATVNRNLIKWQTVGGGGPIRFSGLWSAYMAINNTGTCLCVTLAHMLTKLLL